MKNVIEGPNRAGVRGARRASHACQKVEACLSLSTRTSPYIHPHTHPSTQAASHRTATPHARSALRLRLDRSTRPPRTCWLTARVFVVVDSPENSEGARRRQGASLRKLPGPRIAVDTRLLLIQASPCIPKNPRLAQRKRRRGRRRLRRIWRNAICVDAVYLPRAAPE